MDSPPVEKAARTAAPAVFFARRQYTPGLAYAVMRRNGARNAANIVKTHRKPQKGGKRGANFGPFL